MKKSVPGRSGELISQPFTIFIINSNGKPLERLTPPYTAADVQYSVDIALNEKEIKSPFYLQHDILIN